MAESFPRATETKESVGGCSNVSLFQKRIEFHPTTTKPSPVFSSGTVNLPLETLNPNPNDSQKSTSPLSSMGKNQNGEVFNNSGVLYPNSNDSQKSTTNGSVFSSKGKNQGGEIFENGLDSKLNFGTAFGKIGAGLENLGNTCFLNSVLQCLTYTEPFAAYLQSGKHKRSCQAAGFCALCAIQSHVRRVLQSTGRTLAPTYLVMNIRCISRNFSYARQEDAHEYMVSLLESMHKCCLPSGLPSVSPIAYEKSLVHKIFGGHLRSQVKCTECSYGSNKYDPFLDLSLEIAKANSLRKALEHFTTVEQLDGGEKHYQCQQCKQKVRAVRQLTIHKPPYVLTIHLKRFGSLIPGQKINKKIEFDPALDLKPFVSGTYEGDLKYTLYGVLVHAGRSTHSGHYYCFVRTASGMWYVLDDNEVFQVEEKTVLEQKAYMLFYVRDRRNLAPKKPIDLSPKRPVDVVQKENSVVHHVENKECPITVPGCKEIVKNDMLTRGSTTSISSPVLMKVDAVANGSVEESILKTPSSFKTEVPLIEGSPTLMESIESSLEKVLNVVSVQHFTNNHTRAESLPQTTSLVVDNDHTISHPYCASTSVKSKAADEHEEAVKELTVPVATLHVYKIVQEFTSKTSSIATNMEHENVPVVEPISSKALCEGVPNTVSSVVEGGGTISHFYRSCTSAEIKATKEHEALKVVNNHITAKASAIDMENENAHLSETMPSKNLCKSLPEIISSVVESRGTISHLYGACTGVNTKSVMHEEADNNHITAEGLPLIVSSVAMDGVFIFNHTVTKTKAINEHEESIEDLTPAATPIDFSAELSKTTSTNIEHENLSVNDMVPSKALHEVSQSSPQEVGSTRLSSQPDTEETLCKGVSDFGRLAEYSVLLSSQSVLEGALCKGVSDLGHGGAGSSKLSNLLFTEEALVQRISDIRDGEVGSMPLSSQQGTEDGQNDCFAIESGSSDWQNAEENGLRSDEITSVNTSTQSSMENRSDQNEPLDHFHRHKVLKPKKQLMKFQAASVNLSSSLLFRASLSLYRKKKRKRRKIRSLEYDKSTKKDFREESIFEMEASTSEPHKWQGDSVANNTHGRTSAMNVMDSSDSVRDFMNILTRGLEDTAVARWNGIGSHPSKVQGLSNTGSINIGYVPDEWDVEYDRGKRKSGFDRSNPFQESEKKKKRSKKAKIDRSSSGNRPFRI